MPLERPYGGRRGQPYHNRTPKIKDGGSTALLSIVKNLRQNFQNTFIKFKNADYLLFFRQKRNLVKRFFPLFFRLPIRLFRLLALELVRFSRLL